MTNPRGFIKLRSALQRRRAVVFAGITAAVGLIAVFVVMAAGNPIGFEAETGQLGGTASTISLAGASGGTAVKFGDGATAAALCDGYSNWSDAATWGGSVPAAGGELQPDERHDTGNRRRREYYDWTERRRD
jgi:hypothetical protein